MMSSSSVSEETPHPTISVTDGSCSFSMFWKAEEQREPQLPPSLQVTSQDFQQQGWGFKSLLPGRCSGAQRWFTEELPELKQLQRIQAS